MSKIDGDQLHACFRCGEIQPKIRGYTRPDLAVTVPVCGSCGEDGLVTLTQALDMLNHYYVTQQMDDIITDEYAEELWNVETNTDE